jgi:hypothetical protein
MKKQDEEAAKRFLDAALSEKLLHKLEGNNMGIKIDTEYQNCIKSIKETFTSAFKEFNDKTGLRIYSIEIQDKKILVDVNNEAFWNEIHMLLRFHLESTWKK